MMIVSLHSAQQEPQPSILHGLPDNAQVMMMMMMLIMMIMTIMTNPSVRYAHGHLCDEEEAEEEGALLSQMDNYLKPSAKVMK